MKQLGFEITDSNLFNENVNKLKKKLIDHGVLIFKKQKLNNKKLVKFANLFWKTIGT